MSEKQMYGKKPWYNSKGVWGGIVAMLAGTLGVSLGYTIDQETQNQIVGHLDSLIAAVGGLIAIYGRIRAKDKIGS